MAHRVATLFFLSCAMLSGCSSLYKIPPEVEQEQQEALSRWHHCLNRVKSSTEPLQITSDLITQVCEGQRRDVLLSFPPSVERQLDALLIERGMSAVAVRIRN